MIVWVRVLALTTKQYQMTEPSTIISEVKTSSADTESKLKTNGRKHSRFPSALSFSSSNFASSSSSFTSSSATTLTPVLVSPLLSYTSAPFVDISSTTSMDALPSSTLKPEKVRIFSFLFENFLNLFFCCCHDWYVLMIE